MPPVVWAVWRQVQGRIDESAPEFKLTEMARIQNESIWRRYSDFTIRQAEATGFAGKSDEWLNERELFHFVPDQFRTQLLKYAAQPLQLSSVP